MVSSLTEAQRGRVPGADSTALATIYEQVNADYTAGDVQAGLRAEAFRSQTGGRGMVSLSQKYVRWTHGPAYLVAGNYYAMLGRGLTLRAFELPGVVLESPGYRRRYTPSEDLEGGMASWTGNRVTARALVGRPVKSDVPPGVADVDRRTDWVAGGELRFRPAGPLTLGGTAVNLRPDGRETSWAWSGLAGLDFLPILNTLGVKDASGDLYAEYARRAGGPETGYGVYLSVNAAVRRLGVSVEYKDYDHFALGVNDPPSLVREHSAALLNRTTHVLLPLTERGYQAELTYVLSGVGTVTANLSRGRNALAAGFETVFDERYLAVEVDRFYPDFSGSAFFDWGRDELEAMHDRRTGGVLLETELAGGQRLSADFEVLRGRRPFGDPDTFTDTYASVSWQHPAGFGAALVMERSSDLLETDDPGTLTQIETDPRTWWAVNLNARLGSRYEALLFAGKRRGGTACTSGTCYQVLPYSGVEVRVTTRF